MAKTGPLVEEEDSSSATKEILSPQKDPRLAKRLGEGGRQYAFKHSWSWHVNEMYSIYREVIDQTQHQKKSSSQGAGRKEVCQKSLYYITRIE